MAFGHRTVEGMSKKRKRPRRRPPAKPPTSIDVFAYEMWTYLGLDVAQQIPIRADNLRTVYLCQPKSAAYSPEPLVAVLASLALSSSVGFLDEFLPAVLTTAGQDDPCLEHHLYCLPEQTALTTFDSRSGTLYIALDVNDPASAVRALLLQSEIPKFLALSPTPFTLNDGWSRSDVVHALLYLASMNDDTLQVGDDASVAFDAKLAAIDSLRRPAKSVADLIAGAHEVERRLYRTSRRH